MTGECAPHTHQGAPAHTPQHPPLRHADMAALDVWDRGPSPGRTQRMARIMQALTTAWLTPLGITAHLTDGGATLILTSHEAARLHAAASCADAPTPLMQLTGPTELRITPRAHHGQHTQLWEVLAELRDAAATSAGLTTTSFTPHVPYDTEPEPD
jgi:hypothetical protein